MRALFIMLSLLAGVLVQATPPSMRFIDVPLDGLSAETQRRLQACEEDMQAVAAMKLPIHAQQDVGGYLFDGGSSLWIGDGYTIRIWKQLFLPKNSERMMSLRYGPVATLKAGLISDGEIQFSHIRLVPYDQAPHAAAEGKKPSQTESHPSGGSS